VSSCDFRQLWHGSESYTRRALPDICPNENGNPFREKFTGDKPENRPILGVGFTPRQPRFRECLSCPPRKVRNTERRSREFLTPAEVESLIHAAEKLGRTGTGDATMIMIAYRHALRVSELVSLRWTRLTLPGLLHVRRRKNGQLEQPSLHGPELRACAGCNGITRPAPTCSRVNARGPHRIPPCGKMVAGLARRQGLEFPVHPPHATPCRRVQACQMTGRTTGRSSITRATRTSGHTVRYTELSPERFKGFWQD